MEQELREKTIWNTAIQEACRIVNAASETGSHALVSYDEDAIRFLDERQRLKITNKLKALRKEI